MRKSVSSRLLCLAGVVVGLSQMAGGPLRAAPFDAAPFALALPEGPGLMWEDPREIHKVIVHFKEPAPAPSAVRLEYWGSWWPERHLPKDREPGGGDMGWMELGNWWKYGWRVADTETQADGKALTFTFRPVNQKEFPKAKDYPAPFRFTFKIRLSSDAPLPAVERFEAVTDSTLDSGAARLVWEKAPEDTPKFEVFNGRSVEVQSQGPREVRLRLQVAANPDPNTFDRTLVTVKNGKTAFTFAVNDLRQGPLYLPSFGVAVLPDHDNRDYAAVAAEQKARGAKTLYERIQAMPERTWRDAWADMPAKKSPIYFPMGLDGGRQRFRLSADGSLEFRANDHYLKSRPGQDTPKLALEKPPVRFDFQAPGQRSRRLLHRSLEEESLPICTTIWQDGGLQASQTAFVTILSAMSANAPVPPSDGTAVFMARLVFTNSSAETLEARLPLVFRAGDRSVSLRADEAGRLWSGDLLRGHYQSVMTPPRKGEIGELCWPIPPGQARTVIAKIPYLPLSEPADREALTKLDFDKEHVGVAGYWKRRLDAGARLITPEPMLNEFYRSHAMHLLVNCEREPNTERRFARVGSFSYGAYGNESCMMVADLERRGYHQEARECLDAWLHYQGTVALPGSFASQEGVLYGAGGYEAGGYNQHHGWILWMMAEHYRYTRDQAWLRRAAPGILKGADWIIRETARTQDRHELERGLLPAGSLEDIGDWWTWLSTSCYTWRGLDSAAWVLEQLEHPEAGRLRREATAYHQSLLANFGRASALAPVVRLRDGTAVSKFPSHVHRRGRCFGWICETLEGAIHLLITRALDPRSPQAEWILKDYEDNLYLSNQYGYTLDDFDKWWFGRGGMSMQACLLLDVEPYLYRDDVKHALRALFNGQAVSYFPDVCMNTEHALPQMGDWRGDHFKSSDEANTAGWLRQLFVREENEETLLIGQAVPRQWLRAGQRCGMERTATWFGPVSILYQGGADEITAQLEGPMRNPPKEIRVRSRSPLNRPAATVTVNGKTWDKLQDDWVILPGNVGKAMVVWKYK